MSNLRKVLRALNHCEEWRDIVGGAAMLRGVEATEELLTKVTWEVVDLIEVDADTLVVDVSGVDDEDVLGAVTAYAATLQPPDVAPSVPDPIVGALNALTARLDRVEGGLLDVTLQPEEPDTDSTE